MQIKESKLREIISEEIRSIHEVSLKDTLTNISRSKSKSKSIDPNISTMKDLRELIKIINSEKRAEKGGDAVKDVVKDAAVDAIVGSLATVFPPALAAKGAWTMAKALKQMYSQSDEKKTDTHLDFLNVDDQISRIVDDTVENNFLNQATKQFEDLPDEAKVPNITNALSKYISKKYADRTVTGYNEND